MITHQNLPAVNASNNKWLPAPHARSDLGRVIQSKQINFIGTAAKVDG